MNVFWGGFSGFMINYDQVMISYDRFTIRGAIICSTTKKSFITLNLSNILNIYIYIYIVYIYMSKAMTFKQCSQNIQIFFEASIIINIYCKFKRFPLNKAIDRNIKPGDEDDFW